MQQFVARQPIFDKNSDVFAYELLFRSGLKNDFSQIDGDQATSGVITNSFILFDIEEMTGGKRAFINFTRNLLVSDMATLLPKDKVVIEILEDIAPDDDVLAACKRLKDQGYILALDDFIFNPGYQKLIDLADIIKVDFLLSPPQERAEVVKKVNNPHVRFLAEKVESHESLLQAVNLGYHYFQGYFYSKPHILSRQDIPSSHLILLTLLQEVNNPRITFERLEDIVKRDLSLTYKLLKFINSAAFGFHNRIESVKHALVLLGLKELSRWFSLMAMRALGEDHPEEVMESCIILARMAELLAPHVGMADRGGDLFLLGLFSSLDTLMQRPMEEVLSGLAVADDIRDALLGRKNRLRLILDLLLAYRQGLWGRLTVYAKELQVAEDLLPAIYLDAIKWARLLKQIDKEEKK